MTVFDTTFNILINIP